ncbi:MAG: transcriptional repressor [Phycisphaerae bacterium]|nr:transcriptional repressor [Phycisphaerae bacterium]
MCGSRPLDETWTDRLRRVCRERGLPLTVHRRAVFEAIRGREDHPTADQVYSAVQARLPGVSRTSVYRILEMLVATGMVTKVCHPGSAARFDPKTHQHHHLVCLSCERIIDVEDPRLNCVPLPDVRGHGFLIDDYHVHFRGTCADCLRKRAARVRTSRPVGRPKAGQRMISRKTGETKKRRNR